MNKSVANIQIYLSPGALTLEIKRSGRESDHSPPFSAEVKNAWCYTSSLPIRLHGTMFSYSTAPTLPLPLYH